MSKEKHTHYKENLNKGQIQNFLKLKRRKLAIYNDLQDKSIKEKLTPYMITLSPSTNTIEETVNLRKLFLAMLSDTKSNTNYFSSIELGFKDENSNEYKYSTLENQKKYDTPNFHLHIQIWTNLGKQRLDDLLENIDKNLCTYKHLTKRKKMNIKYFYVVKRLMKIDWKQVNYFKSNCEGIQIYTNTQNDSKVLTKIYNYFKMFYSNWFKSRKNKKLEIDKLKENKNIIISKGKNSSYNSKYYNEISIPKSKIKVYIRKVIQVVKNLVLPKSVPYKIKRFNREENQVKSSFFTKIKEMKDKIFENFLINQNRYLFYLFYYL